MTGLTTELRNVQKIRWARISIWSNTTLTCLKLAVGLAMMSISVLSEAVHSGMDLLAAVIANVAVIISARPPDKEHAFGHGKYENLSAIAEAALIFVAAAIIIIEAALKLLHPQNIGYLDAGIAVMGVSAIVNLGVSRKLTKVAKETDSAALEADALHLSTDVWTSAGVLAGLVLIRATGILVLDPLVALLVAALIIHAAWGLVRRSGRDLADTSLPDNELALIRSIVSRHRDKYVEFHNLRARKAGAQRHIDLHLVLARKTHVDDAHELCDVIEGQIRTELDGSEVLVHIEPCDHRCDGCAIRPGCKAAMEDNREGGLAESDRRVISEVLERYKSCIAGCQNPRIHREGQRRRLELELMVARHTPVEMAHDTADMVVYAIERAMVDTSVTVHIEPCKTECRHCGRLGSCSAGNKVI